MEFLSILSIGEFDLDQCDQAGLLKILLKRKDSNLIILRSASIAEMMDLLDSAGWKMDGTTHLSVEGVDQKSTIVVTMKRGKKN